MRFKCRITSALYFALSTLHICEQTLLVTFWATSALMQPFFVALCLPQVDTLSKTHKHGTGESEPQYVGLFLCLLAFFIFFSVCYWKNYNVMPLWQWIMGDCASNVCTTSGLSRSLLQTRVWIALPASCKVCRSARVVKSKRLDWTEGAACCRNPGLTEDIFG